MDSHEDLEAYLKEQSIEYQKKVNKRKADRRVGQGRRKVRKLGTQCRNKSLEIEEETKGKHYSETEEDEEEAKKIEKMLGSDTGSDLSGEETKESKPTRKVPPRKAKSDSKKD